MTFGSPGGLSELNFPSLAGGHHVIFLYVTSIFQLSPLPPPDNYCSVAQQRDFCSAIYASEVDSDKFLWVENGNFTKGVAEKLKDSASNH